MQSLTLGLECSSTVSPRSKLGKMEPSLEESELVSSNWTLKIRVRGLTSDGPNMDGGVSLDA